MRSLDLTTIRNKPFKAQSLKKLIGYSKPEILSSNDKFLLVSDGKRLFVLDENLATINTVEHHIVSSIKILDITWSTSLGRFIILSKTNAYVFDPLTTRLSCIENIRLRENEEQFISSTCMDKTLFIATSQSYYPFYVDSYHLPDFIFRRQFTIIDLIGRDLPPEEYSDRIETVKKPENDEREISIIRCLNERLGLIMKIKYDYYFYIVNLSQQPFGFVETKLPSSDCTLTTLVPSHEWLVMCDRHNSITQISLDSEFKTEYAASREGHQDKVTNMVMLGSSYFVVLRGTDLEMYQR